MEYVANNLDDLPVIAKKILESHASRIYLFQGDLGAGKTTMIKSFCEILHCVDPVSSPTFSLINHYKTKENKDLYHFDFYRIKSPEEAMDMGFEEYVGSGSYCFIEWPEKILKQIFTDFVWIEIKAEGNTRLIKVQSQ